MKHVSSGLRAGLAMALCAALLAPSALADNGKKPPEERPGNSANAPGHNKDGDAESPQVAVPETRPSDTPPPPVPAAVDAAPSKAAPAEAKGQEPPAAAVAPAPQAPKMDRDRPERPETKKPEAKPRPVGGRHSPQAGEPADESSAHRKVLICHATRSTTNPYVLISVSANAWTGAHGHGAHANDVFVDWSWPGDPRQKDDALCPASSPVAAPPTSTTPTVTPTTLPTSSASGAAETRGGTTLDEPSAVAKARPKALNPSFVPPAQALERTVLATSRLARTAARGTLPFTGLAVSEAALIGLCLLSLGLVLRRRTASRS
jgi:hypothetical protein